MENIFIENRQELMKLMDKDLSVEWEVLSEIGPEWIGSETKMDFYQDDNQVSENEFLKTLTKAVIEAVDIPETSKDHVIKGEGDFIVNDGAIYLKYVWYAAVPYMDPDKDGNGKVRIDI